MRDLIQLWATEVTFLPVYGVSQNRVSLIHQIKQIQDRLFGICQKISNVIGIESYFMINTINSDKLNELIFPLY